MHLDHCRETARNRTVAVAMLHGPDTGLDILDQLDGLELYQPYQSARAELLHRAGRHGEAIEAYQRALELTTNPVQRRFLRGRLAELPVSR